MSESWKKHTLTFWQHSSDELHEETDRALRQHFIDVMLPGSPIYIDGPIVSSSEAEEKNEPEEA